MKKENLNPDPSSAGGFAEGGDARLGELLRASLPSPALPPRFQDGVWRRIEEAEAPAKSESWLDALAVLVLRPRFAFATVAAVALAGVLLGAYDGTQVARQDAQARYLAAVAPNPLR
ncbi:MAG: hypothetical protein ABSA45_05905 [Verrucomicrobiota bacterium]|jgi:hypothetical protein